MNPQTAGTHVLPTAARLVTLEGGEGVGKTTAIGIIQRVLQATGVEVVLTREPGGTHLGEQLRAILLDPVGRAVDPYAELLLMFAARAQHLSEVVRPALDRGAFVVCDRFTDSSYAYQGSGRGIGTGAIHAFEKHVVGFQPAMTVLLDAPVAVGRSRVQMRGNGVDRIEAEADVFFERVRQGFLQRAVMNPDRFWVVDTHRTQAEVNRAVEVAVQEWLASDRPPKEPTP